MLGKTSGDKDVSGKKAAEISDSYRGNKTCRRKGKSYQSFGNT